MRSSSSRLRLGAAATATTLALFGLGGSAFAGERSQADEHRPSSRTEAGATTSDDTAGSPSEAKADQFQADLAAYDQEAAESRHPSGNDRLDEPGGSGSQGQSTSDPDGQLNGGADKPDGPGGIYTGDQDGNNGCGNDQDFEDDNNGWCGRHPKPAHPVTPAPAVGGEDETCAAGDMSGECAPEVEDSDTEVCDVDASMVSGEATSCGTPTTSDTDTTGAVLGESAVRTEQGGAVLGTELGSAAPATFAPSGIRTQVLGIQIERGATDAANGGGGAATGVLGTTLARGRVLAFTGLSTGILVLVALGLLAVGWVLQRASRKEHGLPA
jgi:hypothetical protein